MSTLTHTAETVHHRSADRTLSRWLPLAGVGYGVLQIAGNLTIGDFPDEKTSPARVVSYYADHHAQVHRGGELLAIGCVFLGLFVAGLLVRCRHHLGAAAVVAVGGAAMLAAGVSSASTYALLGSIGTDDHLDPAALQAWHVDGAAFGIGVGTDVLLLGVAAAAILARVMPSWIGWAALVLAAATFTPFGFLASLLVLPWAVVAGIVLAVRPDTD
jgi:hypothetical protein